MVIIVCACGPTHPPGSAATFSGADAMAWFDRVFVLPRAPGDPRRSESVDALARMMTQTGLREIQRLDHAGTDPVSGAHWPLTTLIGWVRPDAPRAFVLGTHFDTPPRAHEDPDPARRVDPVPGANDGTSGVAVLLGLTPLLGAQLPDDVGFAVVLFDGEEVGAPGHGGYCLGSRHVRDEIRRERLPRLANAEFGVVVDMVGDPDLAVPMDPASRRSHPELVDHLWMTARATGTRAFEGRVGPSVLDDHVFLTQGGIPSVLLIDYANAAWHTTGDDRSNVSADSLAEVGELLRIGVLGWFSRGE